MRRGSAPSADAGGHADQVEPVALLRCAGAQSGASALAGGERNAIQWQDVEAEPPGFVVINRYREARIRESRSRTTFPSVWIRSRG